MSENPKSASKGFWSKVLTGTFAFLLLAAVPALALPVLGADIFASGPAVVEVAQSPLTFDAPTTNLNKVTPTSSGSTEGLAAANPDAVLLTKWKDTFDLLTALQLGGSFDLFFFLIFEQILQQQFLLFTAILLAFENIILALLGQSPIM